MPATSLSRSFALLGSEQEETGMLAEDRREPFRSRAPPPSPCPASRPLSMQRMITFP